MKIVRLVACSAPTLLTTSILIAAVAVEAKVYGPPKESCSTKGTKIDTGNDINKAIASAAPGDTFLLRRGTHKLKRNLLIPKGTESRPITIKPYDCEDVTLQTSGRSIQPDDYSIIAGLTLAATGSTGDTVKAKETSNDPRKGIVIRNNKFIGGAKHSQIRLWGNIKDATISGNDIQHKRGMSVTLKLLNSGSKRPDDILIDANKFRNCGEDCFQPRAAGTFTLSDNDFIGPVDENLVDIKSAQSDSFILDNLFRCDNSRQTCIMLHGQNAKGAAVILEGNLLSDCPKTSSQLVRLSRQGIDNTYHVRDNTFDLSDTACRALVINTCVDCDISDNMFYKGRLHIGADGRPSRTTIDNNTFCQTYIEDRANKGYSCKRNDFFNILSGFDVQCTNTQVLRRCN